MKLEEGAQRKLGHHGGLAGLGSSAWRQGPPWHRLGSAPVACELAVVSKDVYIELRTEETSLCVTRADPWEHAWRSPPLFPSAET